MFYFFLCGYLRRFFYTPKLQAAKLQTANLRLDRALRICIVAESECARVPTSCFVYSSVYFYSDWLSALSNRSLPLDFGLWGAAVVETGRHSEDTI